VKAPDETGFRLTVSRPEFLQMLATFKRFSTKPDMGDVRIRMEGEEVVFSLTGIAAGVAAKGTWPGEVRAPGRLVVALDKAPPDGDPIRIEVRAGRLVAGGFSIGCTIQAADEPRIELPLDATLLEVLRVAASHSKEEIRESGLESVVSAAEEKAGKLVGKALKALEPLGIERRDLIELVRSRLEP
jgi:hypothetical protein